MHRLYECLFNCFLIPLLFSLCLSFFLSLLFFFIVFMRMRLFACFVYIIMQCIHTASSYIIYIIAMWIKMIPSGSNLIKQTIIIINASKQIWHILRMCKRVLQQLGHADRNCSWQRYDYLCVHRPCGGWAQSARVTTRYCAVPIMFVCTSALYLYVFRLRVYSPNAIVYLSHTVARISSYSSMYLIQMHIIA